MSSLILPRRFNSQPQGAVELNQYHWIIQRGITLYAPLFNQQGITRSDTKLISGLVLVPDVDGIVGSYNGSTSQTVAVTPPSTAYTMMFWGYPTATGTNVGVALNDPSANLSVRLISGGNPSGGTLQSNGYGVNTTSAVALNQWRHICGVVGGAADHRVYINGSSKGTDTTSDTRAQSNVTIGGYDMWGTRGNYYNGRLAHVMVLPWAMTDDEVLRAYQEQRDNPWQLFRQKPNVLYFDVSTGGGAQTISVTNAAETDSAQAVTVTFGALSVSVGSVSSTESAQNITAVPGVKTVAVGSTSETSISQAITAVTGTVTVAVTQATETEAAQSIAAILTRTISVNPATETGTAQSIASTISGSTSVGVASETDSAQTITPIPGAVTVAVGNAAETESAQIISALNGLTISLGAASEIGTVGAITPVPGGVIVSLNVASETETAQTITFYVPSVATVPLADIFVRSEQLRVYVRSADTRVTVHGGRILQNLSQGQNRNRNRAGHS